MCTIQTRNIRQLQRFLCGIVMVIVVCGSARDAAAQPPVPLEAGLGPSFPAPAGTTPPLSIGPAPGFFPPPVFYPRPASSFDGRPVFVGPPAFGPGVPASPFSPAPILVGPTQPVPITSNFAPANRTPVASPTPHRAEARRSTGPVNLRLAVSESFLNRLMAQDRTDPGPVRDVILGAQVTGRQTTVTKLRADLVPSSDQARIALVLNGDVQTLTTGVTPQAMIDTAGQQQFYAVKEVYFDGVQFSTRHATVFIRAWNQTIGAMTPLTGTLLGGFANRIAYRAAERQKSAGEAVARDRLAEKLFPTFDGEVDSQLAQANRQLEPLRKWLDSVKLLPSSQAVWTTDSHLFHELFVGDPKAAALIAALNETSDGENGVRLSIHESLLNTLVDRAGLKGFKTTDKKLRELEKSLLSLAGGRSDDGKSPVNDLPALPGTADFVTDIEFDNVEPMTLRLERDRLLVTIKAQFKPAGQAFLPPMAVTIPYQTEVTGNSIRWVAGTPRVVAGDRADPTAPPTIMETAIQKVIEANLIPLEFDRTLPTAFWRGSGPAPRITSIKSDNGWATIAIE